MTKLNKLRSFLLGVSVMFFEGEKRKSVIKMASYLDDIQDVLKRVEKRGPIRRKGWSGDVWLLSDKDYKRLKGEE